MSPVDMIPQLVSSWWFVVAFSTLMCSPWVNKVEMVFKLFFRHKTGWALITHEAEAKVIETVSFQAGRVFIRFFTLVTFKHGIFVFAMFVCFVGAHLRSILENLFAVITFDQWLCSVHFSLVCSKQWKKLKNISTVKTFWFPDSSFTFSFTVLSTVWISFGDIYLFFLFRNSLVKSSTKLQVIVNVCVQKVLLSERFSTDITNICESCRGLVFGANDLFVILSTFRASKAFLGAVFETKVEVDMLLIRRLSLANLCADVADKVSHALDSNGHHRICTAFNYVNHTNSQTNFILLVFFFSLYFWNIIQHMWSYFRITDLFKNLAKTWLILPTNNRLQLLPKMKNESLKMWPPLSLASCPQPKDGHQNHKTVPY